MSDTIIVDDQDASISYTGLWTLGGESSDYSQTAYSSNATGATMTFKFLGTSLAVVGNYARGGMCNATFSIDGTTSNFTSPPVNSTQHQQTLWTSPTLPDGTHTFVYTVNSCENSGSYIWLDYLLYNSSTTSNGVTYFFDDRDPQLNYSGSWNTTGSEGDFRLTRQGGGKGSSLQFTFTGTSVQVYGRLDNGTDGLTQATFSVDGAAAVTFASAPPTLLTPNKQLFSSRNLSAGQHTLTATCTSDIPLWIDYVLVRSAGVLPNSTTPTTDSSGKSFPVGPIVGSIVGGIVFIAAIATAIFFYCRHRKTWVPPNRLIARKSSHNLDSDPFRAPKVVVSSTYHSSDTAAAAANSGIELSSPYRRQPYTESATSYSMTDSPGHSTVALPYEAPVTHAAPDTYLEYPTMPISRVNTYTSSSSSTSRSRSVRHRSYLSESSLTHTSPSLAFSAGPSSHYESHVTADTSRSSSAGRSASSVARGRRATLSNPDKEDDLSVAELKRGQQVVVLSVDGMSTAPHSPQHPLVHMDSGIRLNQTYNAYEDLDLPPELPPMYTRE